MSRPLRDFLVDLVANPAAAVEFRNSPAKAAAMMDAAGLPESARRALSQTDVKVVQAAWDAERVAAGDPAETHAVGLFNAPAVPGT